MSDKKFYLTTPIYYVNARPHIGHTYTTIVADVLARRHRLLGDDTFFLTGTDEHGQKIERSAAAAGIAPQQFADGVSKSFEDLWQRMGMTNNAYIRTTSEKHKRGVQKLFAELYERGFIYLASYTGQYCVSDEAFVDVAPGEPCPDCGRITETLTEENFFFKLSEFGERIAALIESNELSITPDSRRNEVLSFVKGGLKDLSISRSSFTWGIPVPEPAASAAAQKHVIYVWLDALANYMTAIGYGSDDPAEQAEFEKYWPADLHLVGKEIIRFHCVYWPAFLLAAGLPLPKAITAHGWLLFEESKMSKSKGNIVRTETILDAFGTLCPPPLGLSSFAEGGGSASPDAPQPSPTKHERDLFASDVLRYFLLREIPFGQDGSFSFDALITRYNADLANGYGNLVSRTLSMIEKYFGGVLPPIFVPSLSDSSKPRGMESDILNATSDYLIVLIQKAPSIIEAEFQSYDFSEALRFLWDTVSAADGYLTLQSPWKLGGKNDDANKKKLEEILYTAAESIRIITALLYPILPYATARVWAQLGLGDIELAARNGELNNLQWGGLKPGAKLGPLGPIFPRADKGLAQIMTDMETPAPEQTSTTHPAAPPRTTSIDAPSSTLTVGGSTAHTTGPDNTPSHKEATPSAPFDTTASQAPITAGPTDASPQITIDDFARVELRVAQVLVAERIPKADKLLRLEVDLGPDFPRRQVLAGIAEWYTPEELIGRRIVVITNLAPRKMRGLESHGMLLAASNGEGGKPVLATFGEDIALGSRLK
jgi:methionyl-tRNA synthetase